MNKNVKILHKSGNCLIFDNGEVLYSFSNTSNIEEGDTVDIIYYDSFMPVVCFINGVKLLCCEPKKDVRPFVFRDDFDGFKVLNDSICYHEAQGKLSVINNAKIQSNMYTKNKQIKGKPVVELHSATITIYDINSVSLKGQTITHVINNKGKISLLTDLGLILSVDSITKATDSI